MFPGSMPYVFGVMDGSLDNINHSLMLSALEILLVCILGHGKDIWIQYFEVVVWFCNHKAVNTLYSLNWYLTDLFCVFFG